MAQKAVTAIQQAHDRLMGRLNEESKRLLDDLAKPQDQRRVRPEVLLKQKEDLSRSNRSG